MPREVAELYESFKADNILKVFIADSTEPLYLSRDLFARHAFFHIKLMPPPYYHTPSAEDNILRFPNDNFDAWKWLLFWMTQKQLPDCTELSDVDSGPSHLIQCWCLGERHQMAWFQNAIMHLLISRIQTANDIPIDAVLVAYEISDPESEVRKLMMEGLLWLLYTGRLYCEELNAFESVPGFMSAVVETQLQSGCFVDDRWVDQLSHNASEYMLWTSPD